MNEPLDEAERCVWLDYAAGDLATAKSLIFGDVHSLRIACMLSQQSAEKALKAMLLQRNLDIIKTRDLSRLAKRLMDCEGLFDKEALDWLTDWIIEGRYPVSQIPATKADAERAFEIAAEVLEIANNDIHGYQDE